MENNNKNNSNKTPSSKSSYGNNNNSQRKGPPPIPMSGIPLGSVPAFLPGSASLVEQLDRRIMIVLRDGRHLVGVSFGNIESWRECIYQ